MAIFMGIDPGFDRCGFGIVDETPARIASGVIQTSSDWTYWERLDVIYNAIVTNMVSYRVQVVGVEKPYVSEKVGKRVLEVGGAWGVIGLAIFKTGCTYMELSNSQIKAAVSGGRADKEAVRKGVETILEISLDGKMDDESDGLAAAIATRDRWCLSQMIKAAE